MMNFVRCPSTGDVTILIQRRCIFIETVSSVKTHRCNIHEEFIMAAMIWVMLKTSQIPRSHNFVPACTHRGAGRVESACPASQSAPQRLPTCTGDALHNPPNLRGTGWLAIQHQHTADALTADRDILNGRPCR